MSDYYAAFADGGFGLVVTEGLYTDKAYSQGYLFQPGLSDEAQGSGWRPIVERVHAHGARMIAQLMHAGALSQEKAYRTSTRGPSAVRPKGQQMAFYRGTGEYPLPVAMSAVEISEAVGGFAKAAVLAKEAGFDGVEVHGANGYLLDQFLSEGVNLRDDRYSRGRRKTERSISLPTMISSSWNAAASQ
jgi:2,4-dienoyl-CoA reductase-like NADH-dependent reductase (Old Yellow Enzyme family)